MNTTEVESIIQDEMQSAWEKFKSRLSMKSRSQIETREEACRSLFYAGYVMALEKIVDARAEGKALDNKDQKL